MLSLGLFLYSCPPYTEGALACYNIFNNLEGHPVVKFPEQSQYPKKIYFRNECYKIKWVKGLSCYGTTNSDTKTIKIKAGMSRRETFTTLIHELLHVAEFEGPIKLKHKTVHKLEKALFELLVDNFI